VKDFKTWAKGVGGSTAGVAFDLLEELGLEPRAFLLAGGCFTSWYHGQVENDLDFFPTNEMSMMGVTRHLVQYQGANYKILARTKAAITIEYKNSILQIVDGFGDRIQEHLFRFDWYHTMVHAEYKGPSRPADVRYASSAADAIERKALIYNKTCPNPLAALLRIQKFLQRGFSIHAREMEALRDSLVDETINRSFTLLDWAKELSNSGTYSAPTAQKAPAPTQTSAPKGVDEIMNKFLGLDPDGVHREPGQDDDGKINGRYI
jgi:hypothetical protein